MLKLAWLQLTPSNKLKFLYSKKQLNNIAKASLKRISVMLKCNWWCGIIFNYNKLRYYSLIS